MKKKIGMLYLCTGPYSLFWEDYYNSFEKNFLINTDKYYYVFTDQVSKINDFDSNRVKIIQIDPLPWPLITLLRFDYFLKVEEDLKKMDYILFSNANIVCKKNVDEEEIFPNDNINETLFFVQHPGHYKQAIYNFPYERKKKSLAYIPYNCGKKYVIGAFFGGNASDFLKMTRTLKNRIEEDLKYNVIAKWHDESHINRYIIGHKNIRILNPGYCYPVGFDVPFEGKIFGVSKMAKFDVQKFKGTEIKQNGIKLFIFKCVKKIKQKGIILFVRDLCLLKKIDTII